MFFNLALTFYLQALFMDFTFLTTEDMYIHVEFQTTDAGADDLKGTLCRIFSMIREFYPVMFPLTIGLIIFNAIVSAVPTI